MNWPSPPLLWHKRSTNVPMMLLSKAMSYEIVFWILLFLTFWPEESDFAAPSAALPLFDLSFFTALRPWLRSPASASSAITSFSSYSIFISPCFFFPCLWTFWYSCHCFCFLVWGIWETLLSSSNGTFLGHPVWEQRTSNFDRSGYRLWNLCILVFIFLTVLLTSFSCNLSVSPVLLSFLKRTFCWFRLCQGFFVASLIGTYRCCPLLAAQLFFLPSTTFSIIFSVFLIMGSFLLSFLLFLPHLNPRNSRIHNLCIQFHGLSLANNTVLDYVLETRGTCFFSRSFPLMQYFTS